MPDPMLGERACELVAFLRSHRLANQRLPERLELLPELPKTASGKVQKHKLRTRVRELLEKPLISGTGVPGLARVREARRGRGQRRIGNIWGSVALNPRRSSCLRDSGRPVAECVVDGLEQVAPEIAPD